MVSDAADGFVGFMTAVWMKRAVDGLPVLVHSDRTNLGQPLRRKAEL